MHNEVGERCEDQSWNAGFEIKTGQTVAESLRSSIAEEASTIGSLTTKDKECAVALASGDQDLTAATKLRNKEAANYQYRATNDKTRRNKFAIAWHQDELLKDSWHLWQERRLRHHFDKWHEVTDQ